LYIFFKFFFSTKNSIRQDLCDTFQQDSQVRIAVLAITAAGVGLTLNKADIVVFTELFWNPAQLLQVKKIIIITNPFFLFFFLLLFFFFYHLFFYLITLLFLLLFLFFFIFFYHSIIYILVPLFINHYIFMHIYIYI